MVKYAFQQKRPKEKAKIVRKILKQAFPQQKFKVRTEHGSAVNVDWEEGVSMKKVKSLGLERMARGRDYQDYLFLNRRVSQNTMNQMKDLVKKQYVKGTGQYTIDVVAWNELQKTDLPIKPGHKIHSDLIEKRL